MSHVAYDAWNDVLFTRMFCSLGNVGNQHTLVLSQVTIHLSCDVSCDVACVVVMFPCFSHHPFYQTEASLMKWQQQVRSGSRHVLSSRCSCRCLTSPIAALRLHNVTHCLSAHDRVGVVQPRREWPYCSSSCSCYCRRRSCCYSPIK